MLGLFTTFLLFATTVYFFKPSTVSGGDSVFPDGSPFEFREVLTDIPSQGGNTYEYVTVFDFFIGALKSLLNRLPISKTYFENYPSLVPSSSSNNYFDCEDIFCGFSTGIKYVMNYVDIPLEGVASLTYLLYGCLIGGAWANPNDQV